ncbi:UDP-N-acetylmuramoyl-tripeptide--D-alanyl-D-alanine ligase [Nocardioides cavernaquae]|uniref:UDP-N-acetylmuramoyl-tripeptide--D-alanyl-D-alanine ligase n=1 Tax=Nocardioides cavernaquae TaxID=2321396 RepID=A0A3A5HAK2_9ACTN|nr:UDP-N-acetylmuramoyl-tripeptide--D-alanyl-D-alanine ligase [Nocardioides cavernaquae]RJS47666.1 UDP-N-acetylmuramoyl-tripeptide--D-alanyl-D-alanine ligase [Nocardioides cavernaquae]
MIPLRLSEIAAVVGGELHGADTLVSAPAFVDSRLVEQGGLFVAIAGEHVDGHTYAAGAVAAGAAGVLGSRATDAPTVVVPDPVAALGKLARHVRDALPGMTVLALTGSQGKTGTKDFLTQVLSAAGETVATAGNFNNEIGVPLTVLRAVPSTRFLVVEMGARGLGHIAYLCEIARPDIAAVINVGTAHLGEFGSREAIAQAKGEIIEGLAPDGVAVLNADDPLVAAMAPRTQAPVIWWGAGQSGARIAGTVGTGPVELDELGRPAAGFALAASAGGPVTTARVQLLEIGAHQVLNAAAAAAMALGAGVDAATILTALEQARSLSRWRMEVHDRSDGVTVINDAYNANPDSMRAALDALGGIGDRTGRRTIAVLSEMRELGPDAAAAHEGVGAYAATVGVDVLLVIGEAAAPMLEGAGNVTSWSGTAVSAADRASALAWLRENCRNEAVADRGGAVVLIKASRGAALELVAEGLLEEE